MDAGSWRKIERGERLPSVSRLERVTAVYPQADRVTKLLLWPALDIAPRRARPWEDLLLDMPDPLKRILFEKHIFQRDKLIPKVQLVMKDIDELTRIGTAEALAVQIILLREIPDRLSYSDRAVLHGAIFRTLIDLLCFKPFHVLGSSLYDYVVKNFLWKMPSLSFNFPDFDKVKFRIELERSMLFFLHSLGFVDNSFHKQREFLYLLRQCFQEDMYKELARFAEQRSTLRPIDPIYRILKQQQHPATRYSKPIPFRESGKKDFKIGNALD